MKKTYNVISKNVLKFSAMFFFTLFFLGMSSSVSAQFASSRAAAGAGVDLGLTQKAQIGVSDEIALEIIENEAQEVREERMGDLTPQQEAENSARYTFLVTTLKSYNDKGMELQNSLIQGHLAMVNQVNNYSDHIKSVVDFEGIVREYVDRLK